MQPPDARAWPVGMPVTQRVVAMGTKAMTGHLERAPTVRARLFSGVLRPEVVFAAGDAVLVRAAVHRRHRVGREVAVAAAGTASATRACSPSTGSLGRLRAAEHAAEEVEQEDELEREQDQQRHGREDAQVLQVRRRAAPGSACSRRCGGGRRAAPVMNSGMKMKLNGDDRAPEVDLARASRSSSARTSSGTSSERREHRR